MTKPVKIFIVAFSLFGMGTLVAFESGLFENQNGILPVNNHGIRVDSPEVSIDTFFEPDHFMYSSKSAGFDFAPLISQEDTLFFTSTRLTDSLHKADSISKMDSMNKASNPPSNTYMHSSKSKRVIDPKVLRQNENQNMEQIPPKKKK
ncbi:MAG: hypothetical protein JKY54_09415 [Flavobacteriales bacterium]|nr:hypothetical protein [Flavobacteriales bacterium]